MPNISLRALFATIVLNKEKGGDVRLATLTSWKVCRRQRVTHNRVRLIELMLRF